MFIILRQAKRDSAAIRDSLPYDAARSPCVESACAIALASTPPAGGKLGIIDRPLRLIFNETGIVIGRAHALLPFMVLAIMGSLQTIDSALDDASASLGASLGARSRPLHRPCRRGCRADRRKRPGKSMIALTTLGLLVRHIADRVAVMDLRRIVERGQSPPSHALEASSVRRTGNAPGVCTRWPNAMRDAMVQATDTH
ncbi:hypothetical protein KPL78_23690 [Roseomonas sp. HJA6]|uniref:Uncharacterized protein n=1 Tax=Roseomonas alba TaxID=2846776 RepID=A0ABS7AFE6_9PROT|nr:hypothetical protein [Neoroseomonas alba]MBW6400883.1 hypothetical protein [Neoroseomonas alba]